MLKNNFVLFFLNIYLVSCAPADLPYLPPVSSNVPIAQDSNIGGVNGAVSLSQADSESKFCF